MLSSGAGQGHDIIGALEQRGPTDRSRVTGGLIADVGLKPADLVILSGIMDNISSADIKRLVHVSRQFCAPAATVLWTRGTQHPDLGPDISRWFVQAGFEESSCEERIEGTAMRSA